MPPIRLVVNLGHALADRSDYPTRVEHHARDRVVVGVGVVDGAGSEVPDLEASQRSRFADGMGWDRVARG